MTGRPAADVSEQTPSARVTAVPTERSAALVVVVEASLAAVLAAWAAVWLTWVAGVGYTVVGYVLGGLALAGIWLAEFGLHGAVRRTRGQPWPLGERSERRRYLSLLALQVLVFGGAAAALAFTEAAMLLVPTVITIGIGLHFYLLSSVLGDPRLDTIALWLIGVAAVSPLAMVYWIPPVISIGFLGWIVLMGAALTTLLRPAGRGTGG